MDLFAMDNFVDPIPMSDIQKIQSVPKDWEECPHCIDMVFPCPETLFLTKTYTCETCDAFHGDQGPPIVYVCKTGHKSKQLWYFSLIDLFEQTGCPKCGNPEAKIYQTLRLVNLEQAVYYVCPIMACKKRWEMQFNW